jgi:hypothetical protein
MPLWKNFLAATLWRGWDLGRAHGEKASQNVVEQNESYHSQRYVGIELEYMTDPISRIEGGRRRSDGPRSQGYSWI